MSDFNEFKDLQLEVGNNFFELIEFSLTRTVRGKPLRGVYGVNVAKVREVVRLPRINPLASRIRGIAGLFELRGVPIPAVNLRVALGDEDIDPDANQQIIVAEFAQKRVGFIVDQTNRIRRIAWEKVLPPSADAASFITGMTLIENNEFLFILDLERIVINLEFGPPGQEALRTVQGVTAQYAASMGQAPLGSTPQAAALATGPLVLLVEDSAFIRAGVKQVMERHGMRVLEAGDGTEALNILEGRSNIGKGKKINIIVTDIEMPRMDGLTLTKRIKSDPKLAHLPVILHSSLSGNSNIASGEAVGANGYVVKNDFQTLFTKIQELLGDISAAEAG